MSIDFRGGKLPPQPDKPRLRFAAFARVPTQLPDAVDWLGSYTWPMYGNDQFGDCVFAGEGHEIIARTGFAGQAYTPTAAQVLAQYSQVTGFDPARPDTDQGAVIQDALNVWRKQGFAGTGHRILAFAEVDYRNPDEVLAAVDLFGSLSVGLQVPAFAMDQFNSGQRWSIPKVADLAELGGHAVHAGRVERRADGGLTVWVVTWGRVQEVSWEWWLTYVDEAWVTITEDWVGAAGTSPVGLNLRALAEQFTALTGEPAPVVPGPAPVDGPSPADVALWAGIESWVRSPGRRWCGGRQARQVLAWAKAKGLSG